MHHNVFHGVRRDSLDLLRDTARNQATGAMYSGLDSIVAQRPTNLDYQDLEHKVLRVHEKTG
jgi:hypothetical protein